MGGGGGTGVEKMSNETRGLYAPFHGNAITGKVSVRINLSFLLFLVVALGGAEGEGERGDDVQRKQGVYEAKNAES